MRSAVQTPGIRGFFQEYNTPCGGIFYINVSLVSSDSQSKAGIETLYNPTPKSLAQCAAQCKRRRAVRELPNQPTNSFKAGFALSVGWVWCDSSRTEDGLANNDSSGLFADVAPVVDACK